MAREIEDRRLTEAPPRIPGPPAPPEKRPARWLPWVGVVVLVALLGGLLLFMRGKPAHPTPVNSVPASASAPAVNAVPPPTIPAAAPATTLQDFAALSSDQKGVVMQQALRHYFGVLGKAFYSLDPSVLSQVATGDQLRTLQAAVQRQVAKNQPQGGSVQFTIGAIAAPAPLRFISVDVHESETAQALEPTTFVPVGSASTSPVDHSSYSLVIEGGTWKVSADIGEPS
jgi:hypothetical protein